MKEGKGEGHENGEEDPVSLSTVSPCPVPNIITHKSTSPGHSTNDDKSNSLPIKIFFSLFLSIINIIYHSILYYISMPCLGPTSSSHTSKNIHIVYTAPPCTTPNQISVLLRAQQGNNS